MWKYSEVEGLDNPNGPRRRCLGIGRCQVGVCEGEKGRRLENEGRKTEDGRRNERKRKRTRTFHLIPKIISRILLYPHQTRSVNHASPRLLIRTQRVPLVHTPPIRPHSQRHYHLVTHMLRRSEPPSSCFCEVYLFGSAA